VKLAHHHCKRHQPYRSDHRQKPLKAVHVSALPSDVVRNPHGGALYGRTPGVRCDACHRRARAVVVPATPRPSRNAPALLARADPLALARLPIPKTCPCSALDSAAVSMGY
jgi:hypothetical protein